MSAEQVRRIAEPYVRGHDLQALAPDVVSLDVSAGREVQGEREHLYYPVARILEQLRS